MTSFYGEYRQKDKISDEKENQASRENVDKWIFRLLLILIGFMPLVVLGYTKEVVSPLISTTSLLTSGTKGDLFTYYKSFIVLIITVIAALLLLAKIFFMDGKIRKTILNYFLGIFAVAVIISTIFSPNISIALSGQYNRSDGAISWLCYIALMFIAMNINYPKKVVNYILYSLYPFVLINLFIITMNFTDNDLMQREWMQNLVSILLSDGAKIGANSEIVGTLNQWNFMSGMFAVMTVLFLTAAILEKNLVVATGHLIISIMSIAVMLMSLSTSGFLTASVLMLVILFVAFKSEHKAKSFAFIATFIVLTALVLHVLADKNPRIWDESIGFVINTNPYEEEQSARAINIKSNTIFDFMAKAYAAESSFELPVLPESGISAGTGRVYHWGKTLGLVMQNPQGLGLDTLMYNFPHYNIDARGGMRSEHQIVDKPHNVYIGILYGTGFLGFIGFVGLVITTALVVFKVILRKKYDNITIVFGLAWLAFLVQAMFNDSLPGTTAPMFVLAGIMMAFILTSNETSGQTTKKNS